MTVKLVAAAVRSPSNQTTKVLPAVKRCAKGARCHCATAVISAMLCSNQKLFLHIAHAERINAHKLLQW